MKKVAVLQSSYLPWKGYFDIIRSVDLFVFYDDVQFTKNDWRNRNKLKTRNGTCWITVPTGQNIGRLICEVEVTDFHWQKKHWHSICQWYSKTPYFKDYRDFFEDTYMRREWHNLSELNQFLIRGISGMLGIATTFDDSRNHTPDGRKQARLISLLRELGAAVYLSGPSAQSYITESEFEAAGIRLTYIDYEGYPEYRQLHPPFEHQVTVLDLLFNEGPNAPDYIWGWRSAMRGDGAKF